MKYNYLGNLKIKDFFFKKAYQANSKERAKKVRQEGRKEEKMNIRQNFEGKKILGLKMVLT